LSIRSGPGAIFLGTAVAFIAGLIWSGCAVGPEYRRPEAPRTASPYTSTPLPEETATAPVAGGAAQRFVPGTEIPERWWELFRSDALDRWIRRALADNPTLSAAEASLRQAQEVRQARFGALLPSADASVSASRQRITGASVGVSGANLSPYNLYLASVDVSYNLDLFGGTRRELEALQAQIDYQRFQREGAYLALTSNIVTAAVREASLRGQMQATQEILRAEEEQLALVEKQLRVGFVSQVDVLAQRSQVAQTRATLPALEKQLVQNRHLLAVLAGRFPGETNDLPEFVLDNLTLPETLPVSLPSSLVRQRPDIRSAEALLHAASAGVGVATANLYPRITLTARYGSSAGDVGDLFGAGSSFWTLGAGLLQPVFRGGALQAERRAAVAVFDQAAAQYRDTVLQAFRNVADALRALQYDADTLKAQLEAETAARDTLELAKERYRLGASSYLAILDAERRHQQARILLVQAQAARFADTAALFQALGGGWWNGEPAGAPRQDAPTEKRVSGAVQP
jgi:NodT family efflux transporter outer membrane factor (OMF) lipoprotein